ncbi:hypothetical protein IAG41_16110 [Sphingomonas sp. JC676]|uniref:hypothetical protein n=1 Tax=Sphingomonas sp. JC676 TaxID=2768065 RepID=UPI001657746F|nr:hypothetical protein [Sphingomonas sp. JC676]MBC9033917.1 hypothetical protein [Sphingomonas sp. JC676]
MPGFRYILPLLGSLATSTMSAAAQTAPAVAEEPFTQAPVSEETLKAIAGREDLTMIAKAQQTAGVSRNSVGDNVVTGEVRISDNAFQNMNGLSMVNVNTGNNVAINSAMNVAIAISPTP